MTATPATAIDYPEDGSVAPGRQKSLSSRLDYEATSAALEQAITAEGLWVLQKIETQMLVAKGGYAIRPIRQILFFHPDYMVRLLKGNPAAIVEAPLKLVIMAGSDGSVTVRHPDITAAFSSYPGLSSLGTELARAVDRITSRVAASMPAAAAS